MKTSQQLPVCTLRFHLGAGENFMKWQVKTKNSVSYYDPEDYIIVLSDCVFKNRKSVAKKIHDGDHKTVCAWVSGSLLSIDRRNGGWPSLQSPFSPAFYNPKKVPNWVDGDGNNIDHLKASIVVTSGRNVYFSSKI